MTENVYPTQNTEPRSKASGPTPVGGSWPYGAVAFRWWEYTDHSWHVSTKLSEAEGKPHCHPLFARSETDALSPSLPMGEKTAQGDKDAPIAGTGAVHADGTRDLRLVDRTHVTSPDTTEALIATWKEAKRTYLFAEGGQPLLDAGDLLAARLAEQGRELKTAKEIANNYLTVIGGVRADLDSARADRDAANLRAETYAALLREVHADRTIPKDADWIARRDAALSGNGKETPTKKQEGT